MSMLYLPINERSSDDGTQIVNIFVKHLSSVYVDCISF